MWWVCGFRSHFVATCTVPTDTHIAAIKRLNENKREFLSDAPYPFLMLGNPNLVTSTSGLIRS